MSETIQDGAAERLLDERRVTWLREHSGLLATATYLFLMSVGFLFEALLLLRFRVNIAYYATAADFLLVPIREPLVTLAALAPIPLWSLYMRGARWLGKKYPSLNRTERKLSPEQARRLRAWVSIIGVVLWSVAATMHYARYVSQQILDGERREARIDLSTGDAVQGPVIASTSQWLFVWDKTTAHTRIVPSGNVAQIVVFRTTKKAPAPTSVPPVAVPK